MSESSTKTMSKIKTDDSTIVDKNNFVDSNESETVDESRKIDVAKTKDDDFRRTVEKFLKDPSTVPKNWNKMTTREQRDWTHEQMTMNYPNVPKSLIFLVVSAAVKDECERSCDSTPEWLNPEKFRRGQKFAMNNFAATALTEVTSLFVLFSFDYGLKPLIVTGKSSEPFTSFKRYLSTAKRVRNWYTTDVWTPGTQGHNDIKVVRNMHANIRKRLATSNHADIDEAARIGCTWSKSRTMIRNDFRESCDAPAIGQCPYMFDDDERDKRPKSLNQSEMAATQFGFVGLMILYPECFGVHGASRDDLDDFCHVWRGLGYLLGIDDEGTLEEVQQRSRDFLEYWVKPNLREINPEWEHMMRCVMEGVTYYFPGINYELCLMYLTDTIGVPMPRLQASLSYTAWIRFNMMKITFRWYSRFPGVTMVMNQRLIKCIDRGLRYTDEELDALRLRSKLTLSKGINETSAMKRDSSATTSIAWQKASFLVFLSTFFLLNLPIIVKDYARNLFLIDVEATLES